MAAVEPNTEEASLGFTLIKALQMILPHIQRKHRLRALQNILNNNHLDLDVMHLTLFDCATKYPLIILQDLQKQFNFLLMIVHTFLNSTCRITKMLYDGRYVVLNEKALVNCFVLNKKHQLKKYTTDLNQMPPLKCIHLKIKQRNSSQPLITLLDLDKASLPAVLPADPQNSIELIAFLEQYALPHTKVCITFGYSSKSKCSATWYETPSIAGTITNKVLNIYAYTNPNYVIVYTTALNSSLIKSTNQQAMIMDKYEKYQNLWTEIKEKEKEKANPYQMCRTSSISLGRLGLNLAYDLGIIKDKQYLNYLSHALSQTQSSLFVFLDDKHHLRYATYYDAEKTFSTQVTCCQHDCQDLDRDLPNQQQNEERVRRTKASKSMLSFWAMVWERRKRWIERRRYLLRPLMNQLQHHFTARNPKMIKTPMQTLFTRCFHDLKKIISHHRIYMYSSEDSHMHSIKFYLADFAYHTLKHCRGVLVKAQGDSTLTTLSISGLTIVNLYNYFDCPDDDFFNATYQMASPKVSNICSGPKPSEIFILHHQRDLLKYHCLSATTANGHPVTLNNYCKEKGKEWSKHILQYWTQFGLFLLKTFGHEVHGQINYASASYLGYQCLWTMYANLSGPLTHALEKTKPYYEDLIRSVSKGGFMFSIEGSLDKGQSLWPLEKDSCKATSIAEMDITSAYGYSAAQAHMPTGFCTGFKKGTLESTTLERLDSVGRHRSFEFRAVYKTIYDLLKHKNIAIRTVYSNFSPFGIFCIGPYPIDLAIITEAGQLLLYQMDGAYCHGCTFCLPFGRYLNGQTHQQVRKMTETRDVTTQQWIDTIHEASNTLRITYNVIQDCCSPGYSPKALEASFQSVPQLAKLVKGYLVTDTLGNPCSLKHMLSTLLKTSDLDYTFIAQASISIQNMNTSPIGPLIVYEPRPEKYTRQHLSSEGSVVLTRDYYQWLLTTFKDSFMVHSIQWILFYAKEPVWNQLFTTLTTLRSTTKDSVLISFLKRIINLTCGMFGARTLQQDKTTYRLVNSLPHNYAFYLHYPDITYTMDVGDNSYFLLETKPWPKLYKYRKASKSALPMFLTVVEYGKLRLVQILNYIQQHIAPGRFKLLYSNIDNIIFALAHAESIDDAVKKDVKCRFEATKHLYFTTTNMNPDGTPTKPPGMAELKWIRKGDEDWKFITIRTQHYCLIVDSSNDQNRHVHKTSGWSNLSSIEAFQAAKNILNGDMVDIVQTRRVNKKSNMNTHQVTFIYQM